MLCHNALDAEVQMMIGMLYLPQAFAKVVGSGIICGTEGWGVETSSMSMNLAEGRWTRGNSSAPLRGEFGMCQDASSTTMSVASACFVLSWSCSCAGVITRGA